jgi:hypothetical protein
MGLAWILPELLEPLLQLLAVLYWPKGSAKAVVAALKLESLLRFQPMQQHYDCGNVAAIRLEWGVLCSIRKQHQWIGTWLTKLAELKYVGCWLRQNCPGQQVQLVSVSHQNAL